MGVTYHKEGNSTVRREKDVCFHSLLLSSAHHAVHASIHPQYHRMDGLPFIKASDKGHEVIVKLLLQVGANKDSKDNND